MVAIGPIEEAYACMAEAAGLIVSDHRLLPAKSAPGYFVTRRFDRPDAGGRLHTVSLAGAIKAPSDAPSSYDIFLRATRAITRRAGEVATSQPPSGLDRSSLEPPPKAESASKTPRGGRAKTRPEVISCLESAVVREIPDRGIAVDMTGFRI
jgi:hypothetical protein